MKSAWYNWHTTVLHESCQARACRFLESARSTTCFRTRVPVRPDTAPQDRHSQTYGRPRSSRPLDPSPRAMVTPFIGLVRCKRIIRTPPCRAPPEKAGPAPNRHGEHKAQLDATLHPVCGIAIQPVEEEEIRTAIELRSRSPCRRGTHRKPFRHARRKGGSTYPKSRRTLRRRSREALAGDACRAFP